MGQRAHIAGAVPADAHTVLLAEHLELAGRGDAAHLTQMHPHVVDAAVLHQLLVLGRVVEQLALAQRGHAGLLDLIQPFHLFQRYNILHEEQLVRLHLLDEGDSLGGVDALMHIVHKVDVEAFLGTDAVKQLQGVAHVLFAVQIDAGLCTLCRPLRGRAKAAAAVAAALAADVLYTDGTVFFNVLADLVHIGTVYMAVHRHTGAHLAAKQVVHRHVGHLALDVPQGHVHAGDGIVDDGAAAPVGVLVHQLPQVGDVAHILADEQRTQIGLNEMLHGQVAVSEGGTAQTVQARLAGLHLHHHQIDALGGGADHFNIAYGRGHDRVPPFLCIDHLTR